MDNTTEEEGRDRFIMHLNLFVDKIYYDQASKKSQLHFQVIDFDTSIHTLILRATVSVDKNKLVGFLLDFTISIQIHSS